MKLQTPQNALAKTIVALDFESPDKARDFLQRADETGYPVTWVKVGLQLFCAGGKEFVGELSEKYQKRIFLDLKFHDIPNTVSRAILALDGLPVEFLTVHLSGGRKMLEGAAAAAQSALPQCRLLGVSYLTSLDGQDLQEIYAVHPGKEQAQAAFQRLFHLGQSFVSGVVCSGWELPWVQNDSLTKICPGIRFKGDLLGDQKRIFTPEAAFAAGANYIVMGRSLTHAMDLPERLRRLSELA